METLDRAPEQSVPCSLHGSEIVTRTADQAVSEPDGDWSALLAGRATKQIWRRYGHGKPRIPYQVGKTIQLNFWANPVELRPPNEP